MIDLRAMFGRRRGPLRPIRVRRSDGHAALQVATTLDRIFAARPDLPMHRAVRLSTSITKAVVVEWLDIGARVSTSNLRITTYGKHLFSAEIARLEKAARHHLRDQLRRRAMICSGWMPGQAEPAWSFTIPQPHLTLLDAMGFDLTGHDGEAITHRLEAAVRQRGGSATLTLTDNVVHGMIRLRAAAGRPECVVSDNPLAMTISGITIPETLVIGGVGLPVDDLIAIGGGMPDTTIGSITTNPDGLRLELLCRPVPLAPPPAGIATDWLIDGDPRDP